MQELGLMDTKTRVSECFNIILKEDPELFDEATRDAVYETFLTMLVDEESAKYERSIDKLSLPKNLLHIKTQHFIELINSNPDLDTSAGLDVAVACFYRKDWSKDYDEDELEVSAKWFETQPYLYGLWGYILYLELSNQLKETYPILYAGKQDDDLSDGRKLYDMLNAISKDDPNNWKKSGNLPLNITFAYLEQKKIEQIKARANERKH